MRVLPRGLSLRPPSNSTSEQAQTHTHTAPLLHWAPCCLLIFTGRRDFLWKPHVLPPAVIMSQPTTGRQPAGNRFLLSHWEVVLWHFQFHFVPDILKAGLNHDCQLETWRQWCARLVCFWLKAFCLMLRVDIMMSAAWNQTFNGCASILFRQMFNASGGSLLMFLFKLFILYEVTLCSRVTLLLGAFGCGESLRPTQCVVSIFIQYF